MFRRRGAFSPDYRNNQNCDGDLYDGDSAQGDPVLSLEAVL